jgi:hypothetical protein
MLRIKTWCLPNGLSEDDFNNLHRDIVNAVISIPEVGVKDEREMLNLFPKDHMEYGLGTEIVVEVTSAPRCGKFALDKLAQAVGSAVKKFFPKATVECDVSPIGREDGQWASEQ